MNKHDFYKEIMSQYTFDESKIRRNAKRASSASFFSQITKSKWLPLTSAAAVFAVVAAVMFGYVLNNGIAPPPPPPLPPTTPANTVSEVVRWNAMPEQANFIEHFGLFEEQIEMYISFAEPMTLEELDLVLESFASDDGSVQLIALWHGELMGIEVPEVRQFAFFDGARVLASGGLYSELNGHPAFIAVEFGGIIDEETFRPLTMIPDDFEETAETPPVTDIPELEQPNPPEEPDDPFVEILPPGGDVTPPEIEDDPVNPEEPIVIPYDDGFIELDISGAVSVNFINGNRFVLTTGSQVLLYEIITDADGINTLTAISGFVTVNPQVIYIDNQTGTLLITGGDAFGRITTLFLAEGESGELRQIDTNVLVQNGEEIRTALVRNGEIILRTRNDSESAIYTAGRNGGFVLNKIEETNGTLVILGFTDNGFKYARITDGVTTIFNHSTIGFFSEEIDLGFSELEGALRFTRSNDGSNFAVITDSGTYVWNAAAGALTENSISSTSIRFHGHSANAICDEWGNWFIIQGTELINVTEEEANALARKPVFSISYRLSEINPWSVIIEIVS
ncbi:MAG: hypothetical protein LBC86_06465 [Oscillospiraceae bacterium]|jgi:hypothetical protein|nr:hypothetical protein [Oscillospiraceae bacterium]